MRVPLEIVREIFEAAARADPNAPLHLVETCMAWRAFVLETPSIWKNIYIAVDDDDALKAFPAFLLFSKTRKLDVTIIGTRAPHSVVDELSHHAHRIRTLEIRLRKAAREPFRNLSQVPPDGLRSLSLLAVDTYRLHQTEGAGAQTIKALKRIKQSQNAFDETDLNVLQTLPMLSSLTALVLHDVGIVCVSPLELLSLKSLRIMLKNSPTLLESLKCNSLQTLDVILEDTSRDGWWDLLLSSLVYPQLIDLSLDATLDRERDDWSSPWDSVSRPRLPTRDSVTTLTVALAFSDWEYRSLYAEKEEYLCGDMLEEFIACFPYLSSLHFLHVPFFHSPFIWPIEQILRVLRKLELNVPAVVHDWPGPVIELPNLSELRYYGYVHRSATRLLSLRTPYLQYLEIMSEMRSYHPVRGQVNRHWPGHMRQGISANDYSTSKGNSVRNFPEDIQKMYSSLPRSRQSSLPVIHQSFALRELRLFMGDPSRGDNVRFDRTTFPALKRLQCSIFHLKRIDAPQLEELYLLWSHGATEAGQFDKYSQETKAQGILQRLKVLDIYSQPENELLELSTAWGMNVNNWIPYLRSLRIIILPRICSYIDDFITTLSHDPHICPALTTINSLTYPASWISLRNSLEVRNHLSMRDRSIQAIHTLCFPSAVHRNISGPLQDALSGEFATPFIAIPSQPWTLHELLSQPPDGVSYEPFQNACYCCHRSGNTFECEGWKGTRDCPWHYRRLSNEGFTITAHRRGISGYLEWKPDIDGELVS